MATALAGLSRTLAADLPSAVPGRPVLIQGWRTAAGCSAR